MATNIGTLYDGIAKHYDESALGLLSLGRKAAISQIDRSVPRRAGLCIVDLGAGTGESLVALASEFPGAELIGIDISEAMLAVGREKLSLTTIVADATAVDEHVEANSIDLALMHYITTFVDVAKTVEACGRVLRPGGFLSVVSTTQEAFATLRREIGHRIATEEEIRAASPAPDSGDSIERTLRDAGFEIVATDSVSEPIVFTSFTECLEFGEKSGFFTHIIAALGEHRVQAAAQLNALFPLFDVYRGVAILARKR
jgi:ubiquinone/menaquinone biosynthesis C-methylase UbiE